MHRTLERVVVGMFCAALFPMVAVTAARASCGAENCPIAHAPGLGAEPPFSFEISYEFIDQNQVQVGSHRGSVGELPSPEDEVRTRNELTLFTGRLRATRRLSFTATVPWVDRLHRHIANEDGGSELLEWRYRGLGDLTLLGGWTAFGSNPATGASLVLEAGAKLPTGKRHVEPVGGDEPEPSARPGTGSFDGVVGFHLMRPLRLGGAGSRSAPLFLSGRFRFSGRGTDDYRVGNEGELALGGSYPLHPRVTLLLQINGRVRGRDDVGRTDATRDNTGGRWAFVSPGFRIPIVQGMDWYGFLQEPLYQKVNRIGLVSPRNFITGLTYQFD
jgi:hypothetical protein